MNKEQLISSLVLLLPLTVVIAYYDIKHRRIPNKAVLAALLGGLVSNSIWGGWSGFLSGVEGCALAFSMMFLLHLFGAMGAGDVKLFGAIGSILGISLVFQTFLTVVLVGGVLALVSMIYTGTVKVTLYRVLMIFAGLLPGWKIPRYEVTPDGYTLPYGVAITLGTLLSLALPLH